MRLLGILVLVLACAAPARADPFGELPFQPVDGVATCLRPTGVPGELARWTKDGAGLLRAGAAGLTPAGGVRLGKVTACPQVAGHANGAAVIAGVVREKDAFVVRAAVRDPGASFGAPVTLRVPGVGQLGGYVSVAVAVTPNGEALVAARQNDFAKRRVHVFAFRRPAGGGFGAAQAVTTRPDLISFTLLAGADARGGFTLAWTRSRDGRHTALETASAPPGGTFGPVARVGAASFLSAPSLAVAPDGRALLAYATDTAVLVAERAPGAPRFGPRAQVGGGPVALLAPVAAALGDDGAAAVAWQVQDDEIPGVEVATRTAPGAFAAARELAPPRPFPETPGGGDLGWSTYAVAGGAPQDALTLRATVAGGGFLVAWPDEGAQVATGALAGGPATRTALGSPVRSAASLTPVTLADGRTAIALADDDSAFGTVATGHGRLQLALPDAPRPESAPPPRIDVPRLAPQRLYVDQPAKLPLRCSGPCDVRARSGPMVFAVRSRATAGPLTLTLDYAPVVRGVATVELTAATPGSRATRTLHVRVPVTRRPSPPVPMPLDLRVKKDGRDLIVSWRTAFAAQHTMFAVSAEGDGGLSLPGAGVNGNGKRSFRVRLKDAARARRVEVTAFGAGDRRPRTATVRLR
jgi:hypothetical protein